MRRSVLSIWIVAGAVSATILLTSVSGAHRARIASSVTIEAAQTPPGVRHNYTWPPTASVYGPGYELRGDVASSLKKCFARRLVRLHRTDRDRTIADARTRSDGSFSFDLGSENAAGEWYVRVAKKRLYTDGHRHICASTVSETVVIDP